MTGLDRLLLALDRHLDEVAAPFGRRLAAEVGRGLAPERGVWLRGVIERGTGDLFGRWPGQIVTGDGRPLTPVARLLTGAVREAAALVGARLPHPWSTSGPDGLRLSDRVWQAGVETRRQLSAAVADHIARGTPVDTAARDLRRFLTVDGRRLTDRPGGEHGLYAARRLVQHETRVAHGAALRASSSVVRWVLAPGHRGQDACDAAARQDSGLGPGLYRAEDVPPYPAHVGCRCRLERAKEPA